MSDAERFHARLPESQDNEVIEYQAVSALAVVGLLTGLLAAGAILTPALWLVAILGVVLNLLALDRIARRAPMLVGRKAALAGLALSIFFGAVAVADWATYRWLVQREARQFAELWFDSLRHNEPQKAHQLARQPNFRQPLDEKLWRVYFNGSEPRDELKAYIDRPEVRALLALGDKAQVRYYATAAQSPEGNRDFVDLVYAVTCPGAGPNDAKKTFFLNMVLQRHRLNTPNHAEWQVASTEGGVGPDGKKKEGS